MVLIDILKQIDQLQDKINAHGKLSDETLKKINYKFRLDWNYHSNALEGNSLTRQETRSVMINNITIEGKPLKDVLEVRGHDAVITDILKIGKGELKLSEKRIKDIHKAIINEDAPEQKTKVGVWKTENNHLINYKNEKHEFLPPSEVPEAMHNLLNELNAHIDDIVAKKKKAIHPVILAFQFHVSYVSIHPFYDGNGRTARILMNLILIALGYPPVIIKVVDKNTYNQYLADIQAYGGKSNLLFEFMGKLLIKSQELVLIAIEGGNIDEPDDLDKKLSLLEKELQSVSPDYEIRFHFDDGDSFLKIYEAWIEELLKIAIPMVKKFNKFFTGIQHYITVGGMSITFANEPTEEIIDKFKTELIKRLRQFQSHDAKFELATRYGTFIKGGLNTFGCNYSIRIHFQYTKYSVFVDKFIEDSRNGQTEKFLDDRLLHMPLTHEEMEELTNKFGEAIYQHIDFNTKKNGIR